MNEQLEAIKDAMAKDTGEGRDHGLAVELADAYVDAHPDLYAGLDKVSLPVLVKVVEEHRNNGRDEDAWNIEAWLLHQYAPQNIGGEYTAEVRTVNS